MEIISTHVGADFDAFASMIAAQKLHPGAELFFPGSREESLRRMLERGLLEFHELRHKEVDPRAVTRLILCDTRQRDRIGVVAEWLEANPCMEVTVYDHHPESPTDLPEAQGLVDPAVGSTSTLMVEELRRRELEVTSAEATVLLLGIYEDTGSLTFSTTSPRDFAAAAWLLEQGGDLGVVRQFALRRLDPIHIAVLHRMIEALEVHRIRGHRVGTVALELGEYVDELAPLVNRCVELFELPLLFALFGEGEHVTIIARGEIPGFDLGKLLAEFAGGGGHGTAAAGRLKGSTALEAREALLQRLEEVLPPAARAADLMFTNFFVVPVGATIEQAKQDLNARRVNAAPVVDPGRDEAVVGAVTRQLLDAALQHGLGDRPVETVMERELEWVSPEAPAEEVGERMLGPHPRFVLVGDATSGKAQGLITRMQVLRHLYGRLEEFVEAIDRRTQRQRERKQRVADLLEQRLPPQFHEKVQMIAAVSREHGLPVYLVGGFVRDLLLGRENRDLDVVVEGDGPHFARLLARAMKGRVRVHPPFLTAVVVDREGVHIDVATARSEFYREPAALPVVQLSPLRQDLYRRDFTINTLAIRLGPDPEPELLDFFGGQRDLQEGTIRVLHSLSFIDDPTRVLRAVRLEQRLGFRISSETLGLLEVALNEGVFQRLSGSRLREELILLMEDPATAVSGLERLDELGVLRVVHPRLTLAPRVRKTLRESLAAFDWYRLEGLEEPPVALWRLNLLALSSHLEEDERLALAHRLALLGEDRTLLLGVRRRLNEAGSVLRRPGVRPHQVTEALEPLAGEELLLLMTEEEPVRSWVRKELTQFRRLALTIRGADLVAAGVPPGPFIGQALRETRAARLDGEIEPTEELEYALGVVARETESARPGEKGETEKGRRMLDERTG